MKFRRFFLVGLLLCAGSSFADPVRVPASKSAYIGNWQGKDMELRIGADGKIFYQRVYGPEKQVKLDIGLAGFRGDDFEAGLGIVNSTFHVSRPPTRSGDKMKMVVDGVELTKVD